MPKEQKETMQKKIAPEHYFSLCTGALVKDIKELAFILEYLSDEELNHHINSGRNDFSNWIRDVFGEKKLAEDLSKTKDRKEMQIILLKHLANKNC